MVGRLSYCEPVCLIYTLCLLNKPTHNHMFIHSNLSASFLDRMYNCITQKIMQHCEHFLKDIVEHLCPAASWAQSIQWTSSIEDHTVAQTCIHNSLQSCSYCMTFEDGFVSQKSLYCHLKRRYAQKSTYSKHVPVHLSHKSQKDNTASQILVLLTQCSSTGLDYSFQKTKNSKVLLSNMEPHPRSKCKSNYELLITYH